MRVVGYIREQANAEDGDPAFIQGERIRAWARTSGHRLVAVCQDVREPGQALGRQGYEALLELVSTGRAEAVVVASLVSLSPDRIVREVLAWDLGRRGAVVLTADADEALARTDPEPVATLIRDVLARVEEYEPLLLTGAAVPIAAEPDGREAEAGEVIIELVPAEGSDRAAGS